MEFDKDLAARQEARTLCHQAQIAAQALRQMDQAQLDTITEAMAAAFSRAAAVLAQQAVRETGFGNPQDKTTKNRFASDTVLEAIRPMRCVGVLKEDPQQKLWQIGVPVGVIAAIVPSTNPTSTVCYKALIALKSGNAIVFSPHPKAVGCTLQAARILSEAAEKAGAPKGSIGCLTLASMDGTQELMTAPQTKLILATGGPGMVRAAYSSGKPAIGVGAGNGPAYLHPSADLRDALEKILRSKTFDFGTVCASEQSMIVHGSQASQVKELAKAMGYYFMSTVEAQSLGSLLFKASGGLRPEVVGRSPQVLAGMAGFTLPENTRILVAETTGVGPKFPYSMEKLCPVLAFYTVENEDEALQLAQQILSHEGSGHTFSIHCQEEAVIRRFGLQIPVSRFLVNTPATMGGIGESTGLFPALTLGCGAVGGSSSSLNISPMELTNLRYVAWDRQKALPPVDNDLLELLTARILQRLQ